MQKDLKYPKVDTNIMATMKFNNMEYTVMIKILESRKRVETLKIQQEYTVIKSCHRHVDIYLNSRIQTSWCILQIEINAFHSWSFRTFTSFSADFRD